MRHFPVNLNIREKKVVVIGGGAVAARKVRDLLEAGANISVIDPKPTAFISRLAAKEKIYLIRRSYRTGDLQGAFLAVASTDRREVNLQIQREAAKKRILLNVVDQPEFCSFVFPARIRRGEFLVTISTGGASPALSKWARKKLERIFGPEYGHLVSLLGQLRERFRERGDLKRQARKLAAFLNSPILSLLRRKDRQGVDRLLKKYFGPAWNL